MKFIPNAIARKVARQSLLASKHSPTILFGAGVAGMVGSTVLACRATLKMSEVFEYTKHDLDVAQSINDPKYDKDRRKDVALIYVRGVKDVVKLYGPAVLLGAASVGCLTKSHNILQERNLALTAAYAAVDEAFKTYRSRVVERYGEEVDREIRYASSEVDIIDEETGEVITSMRVESGDHSMYARWFDSDSSRNWNREPEYNILFLRSQQNYFNDLLKTRGHVFLNEVYEELGLMHTSAGAVVGWIYDPDNLLDLRKKRGDGYIDFGIWDWETNAPQDFFNGREEGVLLDFNVDGNIYQLIDNLTKAKKEAGELSRYTR